MIDIAALVAEVSLLQQEARIQRAISDGLAAEVEHLRATVAALQAAAPPTRPSDYGHEAWTAALRDAEAKGRREMRDEAVSVAEDYDGEGTDHGQYTQLGDASRTMHDIARSIRALPDTGDTNADR